jgi:hypothetical protein
MAMGDPKMTAMPTTVTAIQAAAAASIAARCP